MNGGLFGIICAILAGTIIIALMVVPFSPAAMKPVEWMITGAWILIGLAILLVFNNREVRATATTAS